MCFNRLWWRLFSVTIFFISVAPYYSYAAVVNTNKGSISGRVIVREAPDRLVVTILTQDKRLFQFYARDVLCVTAAKKVLIGHAAPIVSEPDISLATSFVLPKGMEIIIIEEKTVKNNESGKKEDSSDSNTKSSSANEIDQKWVKVRAWGNVEGWILSNVLSDSIVFTPQEQAIPLKKTNIKQDTASSDDTESDVAESAVSATYTNTLEK